MKRRVAVTGGGVISSLGDDWASTRARLLSKNNCIRYMDEWDQYTDMHTRIASPVDAFSIPDHYTVKATRGMGRVAKLGVVATEQALRQAGLLGDPLLQSGDAGVAYGSSVGSIDAGREFLNLFESKSTKKINATSSLRFMSHSTAINISVFFKTSGRLYTTSSACASGSQGIGFAMEAIRDGRQSLMIAGGSEELSPAHAAVFEALYSASGNNDYPELSPCPFDKKRDGLVLGEGACTLILEEWQSAKQRGATILAELVGYGTNTDGSHLIRPNIDSMASVMELALQDAGLNAEDIDYISGHGTATAYGDVAETLATQAVMGVATPFSSLKGYIGHTLGACGAIEAWASINMMNENWFAPNLNLDEVDDKCAKLEYITGDVRELEARYFMTNNFAFGGVNTSLIFKRV
ncbi:beta-ketoacyl-ACP synthase [Pseudomonadales bacterium]|nr:beta-ketoacyl-ACP synthase [Pseudomonadales bacterium]